jgi:hypothetical protein
VIPTPALRLVAVAAANVPRSDEVSLLAPGALLTVIGSLCVAAIGIRRRRREKRRNPNLSE